MKYAVEMASDGMIYSCILNFMNNCTGVQAVLRFGIRNLRGYNVVIADGRDFLDKPLRWAQVS
jgi:hypothetical protein